MFILLPNEHAYVNQMLGMSLQTRQMRCQVAGMLIWPNDCRPDWLYITLTYECCIVLLSQLILPQVIIYMANTLLNTHVPLPIGHVGRDPWICKPASSWILRSRWIPVDPSESRWTPLGPRLSLIQYENTLEPSCLETHIQYDSVL